MNQKSLKKAQREMEEAKLEMQHAQKRYNSAKDKYSRINAAIKAQGKEVHVTDHAIIRYLERAGGLDVERIKKQILTEQRIDLIKKLGNGKYPLNKNKLLAVVENNRVVTVIPK